MSSKHLNLEAVKKEFSAFVNDLQDKITKEMYALDLKLQLTEEVWQKSDEAGAPGGGGRTRAFLGPLFEKAGVNTSLVFGKVNKDFAQRETLRIGPLKDDQMWATGISLIIHPRNPHIPTVHANFRMLVMGGHYWFGGGADLTPYYPHEEDFVFFHQCWKKALSKFGPEVYPKMKKTCDEYFVNHHRDGEMRGIGGIFFDHHASGDASADAAMSMHIANHFIQSYFPIVAKRQNESWTEADEDFQLHRHGRYVEFNLLHDRGTQFGLKTKGRTESILISLPSRCKFTYNYRPGPGTPHEKMMANYYPKDWDISPS